MSPAPQSLLSDGNSAHTAPVSPGSAHLNDAELQMSPDLQIKLGASRQSWPARPEYSTMHFWFTHVDPMAQGLLRVKGSALPPPPIKHSAPWGGLQAYNKEKTTMMTKKSIFFVII